MSALFQNAVTSIRLGIEDYETGEDDRMISSARNYYAGLLLLGKECIVRAAPKASIMEVIGARVRPVSDGEGGVAIALDGQNTIDLHDLQKRFKDFGLEWPKGDFQRLRKLRNQVEHLHLDEPVTALEEAIGASFSIVVDFFAILDESPKDELGDIWDVILERSDTFKKVQAVCIAELENIDWAGPVRNLDRLSCENCGSSLIGQQNGKNTVPSDFVARCAQCSEEQLSEISVRLVVTGSFEDDAYITAKEGGDPVIDDCPNCGVSDVYVSDAEVNGCYYCGETFGGDCIRCGNTVTIHDHDWDNENLCGYCGYQSAKVMAE